MFLQAGDELARYIDAGALPRDVALYLDEVIAGGGEIDEFAHLAPCFVQGGCFRVQRG